MASLTYLNLSVCGVRLNGLSTQLSISPTAAGPTAPLPASARIPNRDFSNELKRRWNEDIEGLVRGARDFSVEVRWGDLWDKLRNTTSSTTKS